MIVVDLSTPSIAEDTQPSAAMLQTPEVSGTNPAETMTRLRSRRITPTTAVSEPTIADVVPLSSHPDTDLPTSGPGGQSSRAESLAARTSSPTTTAISSAITSAPEPLQRPSEIDAEMVGARNRLWEELRRRFSGPRGSQE
jgi:hypothetical protein